MNNVNGKKLRERLAQEEILVVPGAHDVLTAKIIEKVGFEAVYVPGYGTTASVLGTADVGLMTLTEMTKRVADVAEAVDLPIFADADTGYGNAINVQRTVRAYERAGASCIQLEDQVAPKKCGHMAGREVIPMDEMVGKIKAATDARLSDDTLIMARTDAYTDHGVEEAMERLQAYVEAGADVVLLESVETEDEMRASTKQFDVPAMANIVEGGQTPYLTADELQELGYSLVSYPSTAVFATAKAVTDAMSHLLDNDTTRDYFDALMRFDDFNDLVGLPEVREAEAKYGTGRHFND